MIDALISGRLHSKPVERVGHSGKPFAVAKVRAALADGESVFVSVICFDADVCRALMVLDAGDFVALSGELRPKAWTDQGGTAKPALDLVAHACLTAYHVARKRKATSKAKSAPAHGSEPKQAFLDDDEVSF